MCRYFSDNNRKKFVILYKLMKYLLTFPANNYTVIIVCYLMSAPKDSY